MTDDPNEQTLDSVSGPNAEALLAYLRYKESTGNANVDDFLQESPACAAYAEVLRSHAEAANQIGLNGEPSSNRAEDPSGNSANDINDQTVDFPANANVESYHDVPDDIAFETVVREIAFHAKGGLGVICSGEDSILNRRVAIKFIRPDRATETASDTFALEAEITGRLDHPGVTPVHGIGETQEGQRFYVMRFLPGESLRDQLSKYHKHVEQDESERAVDFRNMLACYVSVCKTIAYAHSCGILHRDIKPHNIMLGSYGETIVVDWGLSIPIEPSRDLRAEGDGTILPENGGSSEGHPVINGTLAYMAPEQAAGEQQLTPAADIYALGATLYQLLCGQAPLKGETFASAIQKIIRGDYPSPREVRHDVSPELEAICLRAMELKPQDRYTTALELAEDVERFLADEPVSVHPDNASQRIARWSRHHPVAVLTGGVSTILILLSVTAGLIVSSIFYSRAVELNKSLLLHLANTAALRWSSDLRGRWGKLEHWADDGELHQALRRVNEMNDLQIAEADEVQDWLTKRAVQGIGDLKVTSWYVNDSQGRIVALYDPNLPGKSEFHGVRFDYRTYFHGGKNDLPKKEPAEVAYPMLERPKLSAVYRSVGEKLAYRVALSVPIGPVEDRLGVLTMTIDLGFLEDADLIDMRENTFGGKESLRGIYLKYNVNDNPQSLKRVSTELLEKIDAQDFTNSDHFNAILVADYSGPVDPPGISSRQAAIAPVVVNGVWTGLVVVVEEGDVID
ncbi:Serine/threonine-protein kinase PknD [Symmachiella macrocystis]|uniref:Serine/threonine-protein kinase PknD n=1 Tax=Symmachiella macrocystis TaxID=2527985 RepID=A0A5C6B159_9PLAN|nr:Serine/threonine-protein kinase PknD [Symmachiella macrocystis]